MRRAVFLDRDGVLISDTHLITRLCEIAVQPHCGHALARLHGREFRLIVVSNQTVVARGLISMAEMLRLQVDVERQLVDAGAPKLDGFYYCPHHPNATLPEYRVACECRKPRPGLLLRAAREHDIDLSASFMVGDRISDIAAGAAAGCRTVLVETGAHLAPPIESAEPIDPTIRPNHVCADLAEAAEWILEVM